MLDIAPHHAHLVSDTAKVQTPIREQAQQGRIRVFYSKAVLGKVKPWLSKYCISGSHIYISNCNVPEGRSASFHRLTLWFSSHSIFLVGSILSALLAWPHPPHSFSELTIWSFWPPNIPIQFLILLASKYPVQFLQWIDDIHQEDSWATFMFNLWCYVFWPCICLPLTRHEGAWLQSINVLIVLTLALGHVH